MKRPVLISGILLLAILLLAGAFVFLRGVQNAAADFNFGEDYTRDATSFTAEDIKTVETASRLKLPEGTRGLNMFYQGSGIDDALIAKLQIPGDRAADVAEAISAIEGSQGSASESLAQGHAWWNEEQLQVKIHRSLNVDSDFLEIILGQSDGEWILLVKWFST